jgi:hypothetical protein
MPLWLVLGSCTVVIGLGVLWGVLALPERRIDADESRSTEAKVPANPMLIGSVGVESSDMLDPKRLTGLDAPDFTLPDFRAGTSVRLGSLLKRPIVLILGSYDCGIFSEEAVRVEGLYQTYKDKIEFLFVQVAHGEVVRPLPADDMPADLSPGDRLGRARAVLRALKLTMPSVIDSEDQAVQTAYDANPKRMVLVATNGKIVADSGRGMPNGWNFERFEAELNAYLRASPPKRSLSGSRNSTSGHKQ